MKRARIFLAGAAAALLVSADAQDIGASSAPTDILGTDGKPVLRYSQSNALVIGVSNYENGWRRLPNVQEDVKAVGEALSKNGFSVRTLLDPTGEELRGVLEEFVFDHDDPDARLLVYFAGHGHTLVSDGSKRGYFVTKDAPRFDPNADDAKLKRRLFKRSAMSVNDIYAFAAETDAKHILFAFDACFAGSVFSAVGRSYSPDPEIRQEFDQRVRFFITSGDETQSVPDYSIFRRAFIDAFSGAGDSNGDAYMTASELGGYVYEVVRSRSSPSQPLEPQFGPAADTEGGGDIVFVLQPEESGAGEGDARAVGEHFRDCSVCPDMRVVPAGSFRMGAVGGFASSPVTEVAIAKNIAVAEAEVTFEQWDLCVKDGGCAGYLPHDQGWGRGDRPVINVSKTDARRYVHWLKTVTGQPYRLPSEAEWEYFSQGAVGNDARRCEIGNLLDPLDPGETGACADGAVYTNPVGALSPNAFGLFDTIGNVGEWVEDCWNWTHDGAPADGAARTDGDCGAAVFKGGSWKDHPKIAAPAMRGRDTVQNRVQFVGFRVVRDVGQ